VEKRKKRKVKVSTCLKDVKGEKVTYKKGKVRLPFPRFGGAMRSPLIGLRGFSVAKELKGGLY